MVVMTAQRADWLSDCICQATLGYRYWHFGFVVHRWGLRVMLIWWHVCWFWAKKEAG